jgi:hypothetical protein
VPAPQGVDLPQPRQKLVPTGAVLVHQTFIFGLDSPQAGKAVAVCGGSIKPISVERDSVGTEQLLEPLPLVE